MPDYTVHKGVQNTGWIALLIQLPTSTWNLFFSNV